IHRHNLEEWSPERGRPMQESTRECLQHVSNILCCPRCEGDIVVSHNSIECHKCRQHYPVDNDIPLMFWPNEWQPSQKDVTELVKSFYEEKPFPNYDDCDSSAALIEKAERSGFVRLLGEQIPFGIRILEVGCGTGQLTNYLGIVNRTVFGTDICLNSLR